MNKVISEETKYEFWKLSNECIQAHKHLDMWNGIKCHNRNRNYDEIHKLVVDDFGRLWDSARNDHPNDFPKLEVHIRDNGLKPYPY